MTTQQTVRSIGAQGNEATSEEFAKIPGDLRKERYHKWECKPCKQPKGRPAPSLRIRRWRSIVVIVGRGDIGDGRGVLLAGRLIFRGRGGSDVGGRWGFGRIPSRLVSRRFHRGLWRQGRKTFLWSWTCRHFD